MKLKVSVMREVEHSKEANLGEHRLPSVSAEFADLLLGEIRNSPSADIHDTALNIAELLDRTPSTVEIYQALKGHSQLQEQMFEQLIVCNKEPEIVELIRAREIEPLIQNGELREYVLLGFSDETRIYAASELLVKTATNRDLQREIMGMLTSEDLFALRPDAIDALRDRAGFNHYKVKGFQNFRKTLEAVTAEYEAILGSSPERQGAASRFVEKLLEYPDERFRRESHMSGKRSLKPFNQETMSKVVEGALQELQEFAYLQGRLDPATMTPMVNTLNKKAHYKALPDRYKEAVEGALERAGVKGGLQELSHAFEVDLRGELSERKTVELLASMRDIVKGYESSYKFSDADMNGRDLRVYLHDGRALDIDVKATVKTKSIKEDKAKQYAGQIGLPPAYQPHGPKGTTAKIYSAPRFVAVDLNDPDEVNIERLREVLR